MPRAGVPALEFARPGLPRGAQRRGPAAGRRGRRAAAGGGPAVRAALGGVGGRPGRIGDRWHRPPLRAVWQGPGALPADAARSRRRRRRDLVQPRVPGHPRRFIRSFAARRRLDLGFNVGCCGRLFRHALGAVQAASDHHRAHRIPLRHHSVRVPAWCFELDAYGLFALGWSVLHHPLHLVAGFDRYGLGLRHILVCAHLGVSQGGLR
mmetsp:Transcript_90669/g.282373  ORF Transcript_90669/g.282373 Transcript_90669/m.282373 type:complete len:208 (-) Transcript_90669:382-1005(-)